MTLQYRILWFEDDKDFVDKEIGPEVQKYLLEELGFDPVLMHKENGNDVEDLIAKGDYDLIVTDLNLGEGETGEKIIARLRTDDILTEVLLYSSDEAAIQDIVKNNGMVERVSFSVGRGNLPDRLKRIIALTVKKVQDVNNMRGLVIAEAIDLEEKMFEIINHYFTTSGSDTEKEAFIKDHVGGTDDYFKKQLSGISGFTAPQITDFIEKACGEMYAKYIALNRLIKAAKGRLDPTKDEEKAKIAALDQMKEALEKMNSEVIDLRNDLAHVKEEQDTSGNPILKNKKRGRETTFDHKKYVEIRKSLRLHAQNLAEIAKHF